MCFYRVLIGARISLAGGSFPARSSAFFIGTSYGLISGLCGGKLWMRFMMRLGGNPLFDSAAHRHHHWHQRV